MSALLVGGMATSCSKNDENKSDSETIVEKVKEVVEEEVEAPKTDMKYVGKINGKYAVHMIVGANRKTGAYYYDKSGVKNYMRLRINKFDEAAGTFSADEFNDKGERTGSFEGKITPEGIEGEATFETSGKTMPFAVTLYDGTDPFPSTEWDLTTLSEYERPESASSSGDSGDIDAWLDKYEKVINQEIAIYKKMKNGDMSAAADYASLNSDLVELSENLNEVRSQMTPAQINRLNKLAQKVANSLQ